VLGVVIGVPSMKSAPELNGVELTVTATLVCVLENDVTVVVTTVVVVDVTELLVLVVELVVVLAVELVEVVVVAVVV